MKIKMIALGLRFILKFSRTMNFVGECGVKNGPWRSFSVNNKAEESKNKDKINN